jgi:hypothetical protein
MSTIRNDAMAVGPDTYMDVQVVFNERLRNAVADAITNVNPDTCMILTGDKPGDNPYVLRRDDLVTLIKMAHASQHGESEEANDESPEQRALKALKL